MKHSASSADCLALLVALGLTLGLVGCVSAPMVRAQPAVASTQVATTFAGVQYPQPAPADAGPPQTAPEIPPEIEDLRPLRPNAQPTLDGDALAAQVQNAALRDSATLELVQQYFALVQSLFRATQARGEQGQAYDALPLFRYHLDLAAQLDNLHTRAQVLADRFHHLAEKWQVPLDGAMEGRSREARLRLLVRLTDCASLDTRNRWLHGQVLAKARQKGLPDTSLRAPPPAADQYIDDTMMLARSMECSKLVMRHWRGP